MEGILKRFVLLAVLGAFLPSVAHAGPPADAVRYFYTTFEFEGDPAMRDRFAGPAKEAFDKNDKRIEGGDDIGCIDFSLALDAQDYDDEEIARTLKLDEKVNGDTAEVTATFHLFKDEDVSEGEAVDASREVLWTLKNVSGAWKITDIASKTGDWKLSEFACDAE